MTGRTLENEKLSQTVKKINHMETLNFLDVCSENCIKTSLKKDKNL